MTTDDKKREILQVLITDLKRVDEFEELDFGLRETWINSKDAAYFINHWEKEKNDPEINDIVYSLYVHYVEDYAIYDIFEKHLDILEEAEKLI